MPIREEQQVISYLNFMEYFEMGAKCNKNLKEIEKSKFDFKSAKHLNSKI